jgi:branched-chain amino acid transport system substrate-binding protein
LNLPSDVFGSAPISFTPTRRLGSDASRMSQIVDGRWKVIGEYASPPK